MTVNHHPSCTCPLCMMTEEQPPDLAVDPTTVTVKATGTVVVEFEVLTIFTDTGEASIEDQAAVHMARQLQLGPNDIFMVKDIRCRVIRQERRLQ